MNLTIFHHSEEWIFAGLPVLLFQDDLDGIRVRRPRDEHADGDADDGRHGEALEQAGSGEEQGHHRADSGEVGCEHDEEGLLEALLPGRALSRAWAAVEGLVCDDYLVV